MKKYILIAFLLSDIAIGKAQTWDTIIKSNPEYRYALPGNVTQLDSLNFRLAFAFVDSMAYKVIEFVDTPLDSTNSAFISALTETSGDTLLAVAHSLSAGGSIPIISTDSITTFPKYEGLEVTMQYTDTATGKVLWVYTRLFLSVHSFITFSITGEDAHLTSLLNRRDAFFNSINLQ